MSLIQMSISGAIMILVVIVIRALATNRLPKKTFIALWEIVLLRLLVPFSYKGLSDRRKHTPRQLSGGLQQQNYHGEGWHNRITI